MSSDNDRTIQAYNDNIDDYLQSMSSSISDEIKGWIDNALALIPIHGKVLELGSGAGREAAYIESKGFDVLATDATPGFVERLVSEGHKAHLLNALTDDYGSGYDLVLANAVLLHFSPEQCDLVLKKAHDCLKPDGIFAFSVKQGDGSSWLTEKINAPRQFYFWQKAQLLDFLKATNFSLVNIVENQSRSSSWFCVTLKKR